MWKGRLELGYAPTFSTCLQKAPSESFSWCPINQERAWDPEKRAQDKKWNRRWEAQQAWALRLPVGSHSPLPSPDPGPFSLSPLFKKQVLVRFHSDTSEICAHSPCPVFRMSVLQSKDGGDLTKDVKFSNFSSSKAGRVTGLSGTCQFKYFLNSIQRSDFKQRIKQIVVIECQHTIRKVPKEKILALIWGKSVRVYAVRVERIWKNMKWIHKEPFHLRFSFNYR